MEWRSEFGGVSEKKYKNNATHVLLLNSNDDDDT